MRAFTPFLLWITAGSSLASGYTQEQLNTSTEQASIPTTGDADRAQSALLELRAIEPNAKDKAIEAIQTNAIEAIEAIQAQAIAAIKEIEGIERITDKRAPNSIDTQEPISIAAPLELEKQEQAPDEDYYYDDDPEEDDDNALAQRALKTIQTFSEYTGRQLDAKIITVQSDSLEVRRLTDNQILQLPVAILCAEDQAFAAYLWEQKILTESTAAQAELETSETADSITPEPIDISNPAANQAELELIETLNTLDLEPMDESDTSVEDMIWENLF